MIFLPLFIQNPKCASHSKWCHLIQNDVIKCCKMMSSNVALLHSNSCCVLEPAICEDLDLHVIIFSVSFWRNVTTRIPFTLCIFSSITTHQRIYGKVMFSVVSVRYSVYKVGRRVPCDHYLWPIAPLIQGHPIPLCLENPTGSDLSSPTPDMFRLVQMEPIQLLCGQLASYWNAFMWYLIIISLSVQIIWI